MKKWNDWVSREEFPRLFAPSLVNAYPYNSREGGYAYIYGGPYDADEEHQANFGGFVKDDYIKDLVGELQADCFELSGNSNNTD